VHSDLAGPVNPVGKDGFNYALSFVDDIGVRDGGGQKITKSKSRANVQHKSGEEWEIKKPKK
jgi:hypothetical protein